MRIPQQIPTSEVEDTMFQYNPLSGANYLSLGFSSRLHTSRLITPGKKKKKTTARYCVEICFNSPPLIMSANGVVRDFITIGQLCLQFIHAEE
jgi:hypothetical protein